MNTLEFAIQMELDGEKFYIEKAKINKDNGLFFVCNLLAEEERSHAEILENKKKQFTYTLKDSDFLTNAKNIYAGSKGITVEGTNFPTQLNFYRNVCEMEQKSIDLYQSFLSEAETDEDRKLYEFLIHQEKEHLEAFEEMSRLLENAEWWVESAEFGLRRDEY
jgi:rubrerythrin